MNHQRLHCYGLLLSVAKKMPKLIASLPRGNYYLEDQLKRALSSALLNLAEGNGRRSRKDRNRFFDIALGSIAESASVLDIVEAYGYISASKQDELKTLLRRSYAMIINLKKADLIS
jgi:four helix bundle protein